MPSEGTYCPAGSTDAVTCEAGYYCNGGGGRTPCPINTFSTYTGAVNAFVCSPCPADQVTDGVAATQCHGCAAGYRLNTNSGPGFQICEACAAGTSSPPDATTCTPCGPGTYSATSAGSCLPCRPGSFAAGSSSQACTACPNGTYTFTVSGTGAAAVYTAVQGATDVAQCVLQPSAPEQLVCLPGTYIMPGGCATCPIGYYCPKMSTQVTDDEKVKTCPNGFRSENAGAVSIADCNVAGPVTLYPMSLCSIAPEASLPAEYSSLDIQALAAPKASDKSVFFATRTAVYRLMLETMKMQLLAGHATEAGQAVGLYSDARFQQILSIGVDQQAAEASMVVIGDASGRVLLLNLYTNKVTLLGQQGDVATPLGVALRKDTATGARLAYVSDGANHRVVAFDLDTLNSMVIAGNVQGLAGYADGAFTSAMFNRPTGLAFLESDFESNRILLVADSQNSVVRAIDTVDRTVSTWFASKDISSLGKELINPEQLAVARNQAGSVLVYVVDSGFGLYTRVSVISYPFASDHSVKTMTKLDFNIKATFVIPGQVIYDGVSGAGQKQLVYVEKTANNNNKLKSVLEQSVAAANSASGSCVYPCSDGTCDITVQSLCGNFFLDSGEGCDDAGLPIGGCLDNCTIDKSVSAVDGTSWACPRDDNACLSPCVAYLHEPTGVYHCSDVCETSVTPTPGYTIDDRCVEHDIDECAEGTSDCSLFGLCANTPGSYTCSCLSGYFGDGKVCEPTSYSVYTVVELPAVSRQTFLASSTAGELVSSKLARAYADAIASGLPVAVVDPFTLNALQLARIFASVTMDPTSTAVARMEVHTLFADLASATAAAGSVTMAALAAALSSAISVDPAAVRVMQALNVKLVEANNFESAVQVDGWGMSITSIAFNRSCVTGQGLIKPPNGCWELELLYVGGANQIDGDASAANDPNATARQSLNVLYIPKIQNDQVSLKPLYASEVFTMQTGTAFPCATSSSSSSGTIQRPATVCCLHDVLQSYHPSAALRTFVESSLFNAETGNCTGPITETSPVSSLVFQVPRADGESNDMVAGALDGMPNSEVRLLEVLDYTIRKYRVKIVLAQDDLLTSASLVNGIANVEYTSTFFVGMANFFGTSTAAGESSILQTRNMQQQVVVSKSNTLTLSSYGANQDPLVSYASMQLISVKVTDFFATPQNLYYLQPVFTLPAQFAALPDRSVVPISGIMLAKTVGEQTTVTWLQACASPDGASHVYANTTLQQLVARAQKQPCVLQNLGMCAPPVNPKSVIQFGVPLPIGFVTEADFEDPRGVTLRLQFMVVARNPANNEKIETTVSMSLQLSKVGHTQVCTTLSQSQTLQDIVDGNVYIGSATSNAEWDSSVLKKTNFDQAGSIPSQSFQFSTTTVQASIMTFAALGNDAYFTDDRALSQGLNIYDLHTVHFLEPLGGKGGASPNFDAAVTMFQAGAAFQMKTDAAKELAWLVPSAALLGMCPRVPVYGKMACITRTDSTVAGGTLARGPSLLELTTDASSVTALKGLIADVMYAGKANMETDNIGTNFYQVLQNKLAFNNRYRKAYVLNPVLKWSFAAMQRQYPGSTPYTVCTKIIAIALITFKTATGTQYRRLLSTFDNSAMVNLWNLQAAAHLALNTPLLPMVPQQKMARHLLQAAESTATPSLTSTSQAVGIMTDIPGKDAVSSLCNMFGGSFANCALIELRRISPLSEASTTAAQDVSVCSAQNPGDVVQTQLGSFERVSKGVLFSVVVHSEVSGCPPNTRNGGGPTARRMLQVESTSKVVATVSQILVMSVNGTMVIDIQKLSNIDYTLKANTTYGATVLGGGAFITFGSIDGKAPPVDLVYQGGTIGFSPKTTGLGGTPTPVVNNRDSNVAPPIISLVPTGDMTGFEDDRRSKSGAAVVAINSVLMFAFACIALGFS